MGLTQFTPADWQAAARRVIQELENFVADEPKLPELLSESVLVPLMEKGSLKQEHLAWYKEEEKDELYDLQGQFMVAALVLDYLMGKADKGKVLADFTASHGVAFEFMAGVMEPSDKSTVKGLIEAGETVSADNKAQIVATLKLE